MKILNSYSKFIMFGAITTLIVGTFFWRAEMYLEKLATDNQELYIIYKQEVGQ